MIWNGNWMKAKLCAQSLKWVRDLPLLLRHGLAWFLLPKTQLFINSFIFLLQQSSAQCPLLLTLVKGTSLVGTLMFLQMLIFHLWRLQREWKQCSSGVWLPRWMSRNWSQNPLSNVSLFSGSVGDLSAPYWNDLRFWSLPQTLLARIVLSNTWYGATQTKHQIAKGHCRRQWKVSYLSRSQKPLGLWTQK